MTYDEWKKQYLDPSKKRQPLRKEGFSTSSGIELVDLYFPADRNNQELGYPGAFPFTRGVQPSMYRGRTWTMRQYAGFGTAEETNARYKFLLEQGSSGLSVAFDLPTQMGRDSDDEFAAGEVGRVGVAIDCSNDIQRLFDGIPLDRVSTSMTINATAPILLAFYLNEAKRQNVSWSNLRGTIQNDILKEYIARGTYIYPPKPSLKLITDVFEFCSQEVPLWNTISISGYHIREAGSTAVQEVAFTLGNAIAYVEAALSKGLDIESFAPRLAFFFNCHNNLLEEVAKFRAARRLWARLMRERFGAKSERACKLRFHTQTAGSSLTAQQPLVNIVRTTVQALAAVLGGTQSLHTNAFDEALGLPTEESALLALRTQQVLAEESGVADIVDPFGGSFAIESLTDEIESMARDYLEQIEGLGGMVSAIEKLFPQGEIEDAAYQYQQCVESGDLRVVGVNIFQQESAKVPAVLKVNPSLEKSQVERLSSWKQGRDTQAVDKSLSALKKKAELDENVVPGVLGALERGATLGEVSDVFRDVYGEYQG